MMRFTLFFIVLLSCSCERTLRPSDVDPNGTEKVVKTEQEWREILPEKNFDITRRGSTELPYTGSYWNRHENGMYRCFDCGLPLFSSRDKYDSGTGWPSFTQPVAVGRIVRIPDNSRHMQRTEIRCARCDAHLGHVFDDGPEPWGKRFCINSLSLKFDRYDNGRDDR